MPNASHSFFTGKLTNKVIQNAIPNTLSVTNTKEGYDTYFKLGGNVSKMCSNTTKNYAKYIRDNKCINRMNSMKNVKF